jgi:hypothetical protein
MSKEYRMWRPVRPSNAFKHGVFSDTVVLPTEDPGEFEKLHAGLTAELQPSGSLEHDTVFTIAKLIWRKQRLSIFRKTEVLRDTLTPYLKLSPPEQLKAGLEAYRKHLLLRQAQLEADQIISKQADAQSEVLKDCDHESVLKLTAETKMELINFILDAQAIEQLATIAEFVTPERFTRDVEMEARLDAQIDRQLKRLMFLKGMKEVAGLDKVPKRN